MYGARSIRGLRRGGLKALLQLSRDMAAGKSAAFTVDGPRGPARVAQPGAVWLAKTTGNPVLPFHLEADRHWTMRSWDRTQIPRPFATVALAFAPPIQVPRSADDAELDRTGRRLETALADCERHCRTLLATPPLP